jgi:hypothetical protein
LEAIDRWVSTSFCGGYQQVFVQAVSEQNRSFALRQKDGENHKGPEFLSESGYLFFYRQIPSMQFLYFELVIGIN